MNTRLRPLRISLFAAPLLVVLAFGSGCPDITVPEDRCNFYCNDVASVCTGANAQYDSVAACQLYCRDSAQIPLGTVGEQGSDTVECRIYHAGNAAGDAATHCPHAGPTGGAVCGGYCDNYCRLMELNCGGQFASRAACVSACSGFATDGAVNDVEGDNVQCRITHAGLAGIERGTASSNASCEAALPTSALCVAKVEPVAADCDDFCEAVTANCVGEDAMYANAEDCNNVCDELAGWREGDVGDTGLNTVGCRQFQATAAGETADADTKEQLCKNASETGGDVCGSLCDNYCDVMLRNCGDIFVGRPACLASCEPFSPDGDPADTSGDTVQCRITYAVGAGEVAADKELLCKSASPQSVPCK